MSRLEIIGYSLLALPFLLGFWLLVPIAPIFYLLDREAYHYLMDTFMPWTWGK